MGRSRFGVTRLLASLSVGLGLVLCTGSAFAQAGWIATDLGALGGSFSTAYGINEAGHVVGSSYAGRCFPARVCVDSGERDAGPELGEFLVLLRGAGHQRRRPGGGLVR